jgi:hypothetical protein
MRFIPVANYAEATVSVKLMEKKILELYGINSKLVGTEDMIVNVLAVGLGGLIPILNGGLMWAFVNYTGNKILDAAETVFIEAKQKNIEDEYEKAKMFRMYLEIGLKNEKVENIMARAISEQNK